MNIVEGELEIPQPFSLRLTLYMGQAFRWRRLDGSVDKLEDSGRHPDSEWHSGVLGSFLIHLRQVGSRVEYRASKFDGPADDEDVRTLLQGYFRLDDDVSRIYSDLTNRDASIARLIENYGGMRLLRQDPWECTVAYLCSANNNIRQISSIVERIAAEFGDPVELAGEVRRVFPLPEQVAHDDSGNRLFSMRLGLKRAPNIVAAARSVISGEIDLHALRAAPYVSVKRGIRKLPGVGHKIADCIALFSLDKLEAFPVDVHIGRALAGWPDSPFPSGARGLADRQYATVVSWAQDKFGSHAGYAGQLMFCDQPK